MSASTGDVLYDRPSSFPPVSSALFRGHAKRDPSAVDLSETRPLSALADSQKNWAPIRIAQHNYQLYVGKDGSTSASRSRTTKLQFSLSANLKMSCRQPGMSFP